MNGDRLKQARLAAGFETAKAAAEALGVPVATYVQHENGTRGFPARVAEKYARRFGVDAAWLMWGKRRDSARPKMTPVVGYVGAGDSAHFYSETELDTVPSPLFANDNTQAVVIRGASMGATFDGWLAFYNERRDGVTTDLIGKNCIVWLSDGRVLMKQIRRAGDQLILVSNTEPPIIGVEIDAAAEVVGMQPR